MLYITYCDLGNIGFWGIKKKVLAQAKAFRKVFGRVYYTYFAWQMAYLMDGEQVIEKKETVTRKEYNQVLCHWAEKYGIKETYIRYPFADKWFMELLAFQKAHRIKTVVEIPTYPYDREYPYGRLKVEDAYYREKLKEYVDLIATYSYDKEIWGIKCVSLFNGIDMEENRMAGKVKQEKEIVLIAVSSMAFWNGYERLIEGMRIYYSKTAPVLIRLKLVGEGPEENYYRKLSEKYQLQEYIEFCGKLQGEKLDDAYDQSDIAISSLGAYKKGIQNGCPLKGGEYCARGLPMVCGYEDMRFSDQLPFIWKVPNNEEPIDLYGIINFYNNISAKKGYKEYMREYAKKHLAWERIMYPVMDYLYTTYEKIGEAKWTY